MPYRQVQFAPGGYYHIYNQGCNQQPIFFCGENYVFLLRRVKAQAIPMQVAVIAYCLMPNHYHFLLRQDGNTSISNFVQSIFNSYTKAINKAYQRSGTLFEGPFEAIAVTEESYLLHLCRYIHRNPLDAGLVAHPGQWPYSNYLEWVGQRPGALLDREFVRSHFPTSAAYEQFVLEYMPSKAMAEAIGKFALE